MIAKVLPRVSLLMNDEMMKPYIAGEMKKALFSTQNMKALGTNGLHVVFFKKMLAYTWRHVNYMEVLNAIKTNVNPEGWTDTVIVLIPKVDDPEKISQYNLFSHCHVLYKVISKMIALRLKLFLVI